jgi:hypothetical protein
MNRSTGPVGRWALSTLFAVSTVAWTGFAAPDIRAATVHANWDIVKATGQTANGIDVIISPGITSPLLVVQWGILHPTQRLH